MFCNPLILACLEKQERSSNQAVFLAYLFEDFSNRLALLVDFAIIWCHIYVQDDLLDRLVFSLLLLSFDKFDEQILRDASGLEGACEDWPAEVVHKLLRKSLLFEEIVHIAE